MKGLNPFANESESLTIGGLTVENRTDRISLYGELDLTRDKQGLAHARALAGLLKAVIQTLEGEEHGLPTKAAAPGKPRMVRNPFG